MTLRSTAFILLLIASLIAFSGCKTGQDQLKLFDKALKGYNSRLQFKQLMKAADYIETEKRPDFLDDMELTLEKKNIINIEIRSVTMNEDKTEATVKIVRELYDNSSFEVKKEPVNQTWKRINGKWVLSDGDF